jgi:hypothetical protein
MDETCVFDACLTGFGDCDADPTNGCEVDLTTDVASCGACAAACTLPGATPACVDGLCAVGACDAGFGDCDVDPVNGCELALVTLTDCGACGTACAPANATGDCATGACAIGTCNASFDDCDTDPGNGCEQSLITLAHCGACGTVCTLPNATETCATGSCAVLACNTNFGDCDAMASNGCETDLLRNNLHCGMCGIACVGGDRCRTGVCR